MRCWYPSCQTRDGKSKHVHVKEKYGWFQIFPDKVFPVMTIFQLTILQYLLKQVIKQICRWNFKWSTRALRNFANCDLLENTMWTCHWHYCICHYQEWRERMICKQNSQILWPSDIDNLWHFTHFPFFIAPGIDSEAFNKKTSH